MVESLDRHLDAALTLADVERSHDLRVLGYAEQVAGAEARRDLAYDLQVARTEQALVRERVGVARVEREARIEVESLEIERKSRELVHQVHRPAEAERYRAETLADGERYRRRLEAEAEAEMIRARGTAEADAIRARGLAEAEVIRQKALAEAEGVKAKLLAEAEGMKQKAAAWEQYTAPAISQILIEQLPGIAAAVAGPLERIDRIVMVNSGNGDSTGVERITQGVTNVMAQLPGMAELLGSLKLGDVVQQLRAAAASSAGGNGAGEGGAAGTDDGSQGRPT